MVAKHLEPHTHTLGEEKGEGAAQGHQTTHRERLQEEEGNAEQRKQREAFSATPRGGELA